MKKIICALLAVVLAFAAVMPVAAKDVDVLSFGRISVNMPEICVELKGGGFQKEDVSAALDSEKLEVSSLSGYDKNVCTTCAYVLVDLSTSMRGSFSLVKENIVSFINLLGENDRIVLITFGEKEVRTVLEGGEDRATAVSTVEALRCNENGTLFYEALSRAYQLSNSSSASYDREYVVAFSDGIDLQKGSTTFDEVMKQYNSHALPLYAACSGNASKDSSDKFGQIARASGGGISIINGRSDFGSFLSDINDVTVVKLKAQSNYADGQEKLLAVRVGSSQIECSVPVTRSIPDNEPPTVDSIYFDPDSNSICISFSETVNGASETGAYKITGANGQSVAVASVFYSEANNVYEIKPQEALRIGTYTVEFSGIRDASREANPLTGSCTFEASRAGRDGKTGEGGGLLIWIIILIVLIIIVLALVVLLLMKRGKPDEQNDWNGQQSSATPVKEEGGQIDHVSQNGDSVKHHIIINDSARIRLIIKTGRVSEQNIETTIGSSLIVGRSETCDIFIDDTKLSRQHFVIENDGGNFYIMDLQSKNGTILNGIRITTRQNLKSGDKILAGLSDIIFQIIG